jgi:hypothetical protein
VPRTVGAPTGSALVPRARSIFRAEVTGLGVPSPAETLPPIPCEFPSQAVRTIPCSPSPPLLPLDLIPSTRAVLAALSVTHDTRRERDARAAPHEIACAWRARACLSSVGASSIMKTLIVEIELS